VRPTPIDAAWVGLGAIVSGLGGFGFTWAVARGSGAAGAGVVLTLTTWFILLVGITKLGMDTTLVREGGRIRAGEAVTGARAVMPWTLRPAVGVALSVGLLIAFAAPVLGPLVVPDSAADLTPMLVVGGLALPAGVYTIVTLALVRGLGGIGPFVWIEQIGKPGGRTLAALVLLVMGVSASGAYYAVWLLPVAIGSVLAWWCTRRALASDPGGSLDRVERHRVWRYSSARGMSQIVDLVNTSLGTILLGTLAGAAAAGLYATAFRIVVFGQLAFQAVSLLLAPSLAALLASRRVREADDAFATGTVLIVLAAWPVFLVCLILPELVLSVFGPSFVAAAPTLQILAVSGLLLAVVGNQGSLILMSGRSGFALVALLASLAVNLAATLSLVGTLGSMAAAIGWTSGILVEGVILALGMRALGVRPLPRTALKAALLTGATIGMGLVGFRLLLTENPLMAWTALVVSGLIWVALCGPLGRSSFVRLTHQAPSDKVAA
jgi:O-antigen/teichoic acid export membrane protein